MREERAIAISALLVFATLTAAELQENDRLPTTRMLIGYTLAFFLMSALNDMGVKAGAGIATVFMVAVLLTRGDEAMKFATTSTLPEKEREKIKRAAAESGTIA